MTTPTQHNGAQDFDFFIGQWRVAHRRLRQRLAGCTDWDEFVGTTSVRKVLGGQGNVDDNFLDLPGDPYHAVTLRTWDAAAQQWSIWWLDGRAPGGLDVPMRGRFEGGVGTFLAADLHAGQPVTVRFLWTQPAPDAPRWEQAFSTDGGATWETNWVMDFSRLAQGPGDQPGPVSTCRLP
ncbi:MAG: DUF1579 domain-containing protein [Ramlibacter sp.]